MPPGRRIIYIKNPKQGSHFRTIGSDGGGKQPPKRPSLFDILDDLFPSFTPKPNGPGIPGSPGGPVTLTGGAIYGTSDSDWFIHKPGKPDYGQPGVGGSGPYEQTWTSDFVPPTTIWGDLYLIAIGVDPATGNILHAAGTPGTLRPFPEMSFGYGETWKDEEYRLAGMSVAFFGKRNKKGFVPTPPSYRAPNRNNKRPWWAK